MATPMLFNLALTSLQLLSNKFYAKTIFIMKTVKNSNTEYCFLI